MTSLTTEQMVVATSTFQESFTHVLGNYVGESREHIVKFVANIILREKPYMLVTEAGLQHAMQIAFGNNDAERDFLLMLTFTFFSRFGETDNPVKALSTNLARGVALGNNNDLNAVPEQLKKRLPIESDAHLVLEANQWLITLLMLQLCITAIVNKE
jgi:hypothetical protein